MARDNGGPAFPNGMTHPNREGMTLRDYFAGQALSAFIFPSMGVNGDPPLSMPPTAIAAWAYYIADAMLAERNKDPVK